MPHDHASFPDEPLQLEIRCTASKPLLSILRRFVSCVAEQLGFSEEEMCMIEMAVDEACTNAVVHGIGVTEAADDAIGLRVEITPTALTIHVRDSGRLEDAAMLRGVESIDQYVDPGREAYRGLGLLVMRQFMDDVEIRTCPESGTTVILRKYLKRAGESPATHPPAGI